VMSHRAGKIMATLVALTVPAAGFEELSDTVFPEMVTHSQHHNIILWRQGGMRDPDEAVRAFEDASKQFQTQPGYKFAYVDASEPCALASQFAVTRLPMVTYFAPGSTETPSEATKIPIGYNNPNIMSGIVIDPGFIANRLRKAVSDAELRVLEKECRDNEANCQPWAAAGECETNPGFMHGHCKRSCLDKGFQDACPGVKSSVPKTPKCFDKGGTNCQDWAKNGDCEKNAVYMLPECQHSCKQCTMDADDEGLLQEMQMHEAEKRAKAIEAVPYHIREKQDRENERRHKSGEEL